MALTWLPFLATRYRPACYQDLLSGKQLFQRIRHGTLDECMVEITAIAKVSAKTIAGDAYFLTWQWKECPLHLDQGYLHTYPFTNELEYKAATKCCCRLFTIREQSLSVRTPY